MEWRMGLTHPPERGVFLCPKSLRRKDLCKGGRFYTNPCVASRVFVGKVSKENLRSSTSCVLPTTGFWSILYV